MITVFPLKRYLRRKIVKKFKLNIEKNFNDIIYARNLQDYSNIYNINKGLLLKYFKLKGVEEYACLHQIRSVDYRRLFSKLGRLDDSDYKKVKDGFLKLYE